MFKVSVRRKFAILRNFTFLSGSINLKVICKIKKNSTKNIVPAASYFARKVFFILNT